jgi:hypothetical protein
MNYLFSKFEISTSQISLLELKNVLLPQLDEGESEGPIRIQFSGLNFIQNALQGKSSFIQINGVSYQNLNIIFENGKFFNSSVYLGSFFALQQSAQNFTLSNVSFLNNSG